MCEILWFGKRARYVIECMHAANVYLLQEKKRVRATSEGKRERGGVQCGVQNLNDSFSVLDSFFFLRSVVLSLSFYIHTHTREFFRRFFYSLFSLDRFIAIIIAIIFIRKFSSKRLFRNKLSFYFQQILCIVLVCEEERDGRDVQPLNNINARCMYV